MTKHTPGPYRIGAHPSEEGPSYPYEVCIYSADSIRLATMENWEGERESAEAEANANLFAAAPDLLAAARIALDCFDYARKFVDADEWMEMPGHLESQKALQAAIAKATT